MRINLLTSKFGTLTEKQIAFLIVLLITIIYLHPIFLGKVDTPIDIRNITMYPWRYYAVDKKVKNIILWKYEIPSEKKFIDKEINLKVLKLDTPPNNTNNFLLRLNLDESQLNELQRSKEVNYYLTAEFKPVYSKSLAISFGFSLVNKVTGNYFKPGIAILPSSYYKEDQLTTWYKLLFPLNEHSASVNS